MKLASVWTSFLVLNEDPLCQGKGPFTTRIGCSWLLHVRTLSENEMSDTQWILSGRWTQNSRHCRAILSWKHQSVGIPITLGLICQSLSCGYHWYWHGMHIFQLWNIDEWRGDQKSENRGADVKVTFGGDFCSIQGLGLLFLTFVFLVAQISSQFWEPSNNIH